MYERTTLALFHTFSKTSIIDVLARPSGSVVPVASGQAAWASSTFYSKTGRDCIKEASILVSDRFLPPMSTALEEEPLENEG